MVCHKKPAPALVKKRSVVAQGISGGSLFQSVATSKLFLVLLTFFLVNVAWVFFRAPDFTTAWRLIESMFGYAANGTALLPTLEIIKVSIITVLLVATHWVMRDRSVIAVSQRMKWWVTGIAWSLLIIAIILSQKSSDSFIYFQF